MKNLNILALLTFIMVFSAGCGSDEVYKIYPSKKANCDILLNIKNGDTWFNCSGYWEKSSKDIEQTIK